jgi:1-acyl-sn-glycerol-3-phosphate acyltransferase
VTEGRIASPRNVQGNVDPSAVFRDTIIHEIFYALGLSRSGAIRRLLGPVFRPAASRFGRIAALADGEVPSSGICGAARRILGDLALSPKARGTENIPREGPLILVSNHPGAFDSVAILSCVPRKDMKVFISDVPFTRAFPAASGQFIYVPKNAGGRQAALRSSIDHLKAGGSLLIFAHGDVEPDPELTPGASEAIQDWSRSIEIMLRRVPEAWLQVAIASGVLMPKFVRHPLVKIRKTAPRRQKLAEVLQICQQMLFPRSVRIDVHLSFAAPVKVTDLPGKDVTAGVVQIARRLLEDHMASLRTAP